MAPRPQTVFNALIRRCIDLRALYRDAATEAAEPGLRAVLEENLDVLDTVIADLQSQVAGSGGRPARRGRAGGTVHRHVMEWLLPHDLRRDSAWIGRLARAETALVRTCERSLGQMPPEAVAVMLRQRARLESIHLDMHSLAGVR